MAQGVLVSEWARGPVSWMGGSLAAHPDRCVGSGGRVGGMRADVVLEGVSGHFDALKDLPLNPTQQSSKFSLQVQ